MKMPDDTKTFILVWANPQPFFMLHDKTSINSVAGTRHEKKRNEFSWTNICVLSNMICNTTYDANITWQRSACSSLVLIEQLVSNFLISSEMSLMIKNQCNNSYLSVWRVQLNLGWISASPSLPRWNEKKTTMNAR